VKIVAALVFVFAMACGAMAQDPLEFSVGSFPFERPAEWKWQVPSSSMRKAQLLVPGANKESADVTFFHFGAGQGGGIQGNVDRWFAQFGNSNTAQREVVVGRTRIIYVEAEGTFQSGMPGGPTTPLENYALRGAILEDTGSGDVFVKMTGPAPLVLAAWPRFDEMVRAAASKRSDSSNP
jgi:hypothetical protein